jgi:hypothetical protein
MEEFGSRVDCPLPEMQQVLFGSQFVFLGKPHREMELQLYYKFKRELH